jgi:hypothetical protein
MAFNVSAWQAMIPNLVGRARLMNVVGRNSAAFTAAAVIGPAVAGATVSALCRIGTPYTGFGSTPACGTMWGTPADTS